LTLIINYLYFSRSSASFSQTPHAANAKHRQKTHTHTHGGTRTHTDTANGERNTSDAAKFWRRFAAWSPKCPKQTRGGCKSISIESNYVFSVTRGVTVQERVGIPSRI